MASVASQSIEEVTAHAQRDSLEDAREICADGTYIPNDLRTISEDTQRNYRTTSCLYSVRSRSIAEGGPFLPKHVTTKRFLLHVK